MPGLFIQGLAHYFFNTIADSFDLSCTLCISYNKKLAYRVVNFPKIKDGDVLTLHFFYSFHDLLNQWIFDIRHYGILFFCKISSFTLAGLHSSLFVFERDGILFKRIYRLNEVDSTNAFLKRQIEQGNIFDFTLAATEYQTSGRGQMGTSWQAERGKNLLFSAYLPKIPLKVEQQHLLSMSICLAMHDVVNKHVVGAKIKWPNDILIGGRKLGGTLIENTLQGKWLYSILGIGLNVNQTNFHDDLRATSLRSVAGKSMSVEAVLETLVQRLEDRLLHLWRDEHKELKENYELHLEGRNEWRDFLYKNQEVYARISGVDAYGQLLLEMRSGRILKPGIKELKYLWL